MSHHLAQRGDFGYSDCARKTVRAGFGDLDFDRRITADMAVFSCPLANVRLLWAGLGGDTFGYAGVLSSRFANPALCPPSHLAMGCGSNDSIGGLTMAALPTPAHSAHTFPLTEKAARRTARQWFSGTPTTTLVTWRDACRARHCDALPADPARVRAFNVAFASELATIIAGGLSHE